MKKNAFTLMEVLVTLVVMSLLAVAVYGIFISAMIDSKRAEDIETAGRLGQSILLLMERDLKSALPVVPEAELYAGKLCAALDRQHPRDLFDVHILLKGAGVASPIRRAFTVYLAAHNRPMHELLQP